MDLVNDNVNCPAIGYQATTVCVPVTVIPYAKAGATVTKCCGNATVISGKQVCSGVKNGICSFTMSQNLCIAVPVDFGANAMVGEAYIDCKGASAEDICSDCSTDIFAETEPKPVVVE